MPSKSSVALCPCSVTDVARGLIASLVSTFGAIGNASFLHAAKRQSRASQQKKFLELSLCMQSLTRQAKDNLR